MILNGRSPSDESICEFAKAFELSNRSSMFSTSSVSMSMTGMLDNEVGSAVDSPVVVLLCVSIASPIFSSVWDAMPEKTKLDAKSDDGQPQGKSMIVEITAALTYGCCAELEMCSIENGDYDDD